MNNEEIITIPNFITLFRIVCIPFFILSLVYNKDAWAVLIFAAMSLSDALDGISARLTNQKTKIGALLDTTADNLVVFSTLLTFTIIRGMIPFYITIALFVAFILCALAKIIYVKKGPPPEALKALQETLKIPIIEHLPESESATTTADILVILGDDYQE